VRELKAAESTSHNAVGIVPPGEELLATAEQDRVDPQVQPIDQIMPQQRPDEVTLPMTWVWPWFCCVAVDDDLGHDLPPGCSMNVLSLGVGSAVDSISTGPTRWTPAAPRSPAMPPPRPATSAPRRRGVPRTDLSPNAPGVSTGLVGSVLLPFVKAWLDDTITQASAVLEAETFDRAWHAGHAMMPDNAVAEAMRELDLAEKRRRNRRLTSGRPPAVTTWPRIDLRHRQKVASKDPRRSHTYSRSWQQSDVRQSPHIQRRRQQRGRR
jgi:hypothetical protein